MQQGERALPSRQPDREIVRLIWTVAACMGLVLLLSTTLGSSANTRRLFNILASLWLPEFREYLPPMELRVYHTLVRKAAHVLLYALLGLVTVRLFQCCWPKHRWYAMAGAFICSLLCAALDEWHQSYVDSRTASERDVALDAMGALLGISLSRTKNWRR